MFLNMCYNISNIYNICVIGYITYSVISYKMYYKTCWIIAYIIYNRICYKIG